MDYHYTIPGPNGPGSMRGGGGHDPASNPTLLTTALILDPTGPGYRLDSKWGRGGEGGDEVRRNAGRSK